MIHLPSDPMLCLSVINTKLRDCYSSLDALCEDLEVEKDVIIQKLNQIDYFYDSEKNQFI